MTDARNILVGAEKFRWSFTPGAQGSELRVQHAQTSAVLTVAMPAWRAPSPVRNDPKTMTPAFVTRAIQFAIEEGWSPATSGLAWRAAYQAGQLGKL